MQTWLALFRGINVGGKHIVPMKVLANLMTEAGCQEVQTYIQSGNVIFKHSVLTSAELAVLLAELVFQHFAFKPKVMIFSATQFSQILATNPYMQVYTEAKQVHVFFFEHAPLAPDLVTLQQLKAPSEDFELQQNGLYLFAPEGIGRSKLVDKIDKCLGVSTTARNLNTLMKLNHRLNL